MLPIRIAILSDDRLFSEGLLRIVGAESSFVVVGGDEGAPPGSDPRTAGPDVLLVDSRMKEALALCAEIKRKGGPAVVFVAAPDEDNWAPEALGAGACGILAKSAGPEDLVKAVRAVHGGQIWARRHVMAAWMKHLAGAHGARCVDETLLERGLSGREREVFRHAATGLSNKELAHRLAISQATVKAHLTHIFQKLGLRGRVELAAAYHGLVSLGARRAAALPPSPLSRSPRLPDAPIVVRPKPQVLRPRHANG